MFAQSDGLWGATGGVSARAWLATALAASCQWHPHCAFFVPGGFV